MFVDFGTKDTDTRQSKSTFQKTRFLSVVEGQPAVVRLLQKNSYRVYTHYINQTTVACLDDECPICANNKRLIVENPGDYKNSPGWNSATRRYFTNVLDRTMVKVCPNTECQAENRMIGDKWMPTCYACNTFITAVEEKPSNKVKVFSYGPYVKDDLDALAVHPITRKPVDLFACDIALVATGQSKNKRIKAQLLHDQNDKVEVPEDALYDLEKTVLHLTADELLNLQRGVSLKDIFNARKEDKAEVNPLKEISDKDKQELTETLDKMFPN